MDPVVWFVTPVYQRIPLTAICLEQRARMLAALPFEAQAVVIGDDESVDLAESLGLETVRMDNSYVGRKFNAGFEAACKGGATHAMAIGSDSWLSPTVFEGAEWNARDGIGIIGLSSFSPYGDERIDLAIKYPSGFGVGMVYPTWCLMREPCTPTAQYGCDGSTWARCGRGRINLHFQEEKRYGYCNFHSPDTQITDYRAVKKAWNRVEHLESDPDAVLAPLYEHYDADLIERLKELYAVRSVHAFLTGEHGIGVSPHKPTAMIGRGKASKDTRERVRMSTQMARAMQERNARRAKQG